MAKLSGGGPLQSRSAKRICGLTRVDRWYHNVRAITARHRNQDVLFHARGEVLSELAPHEQGQWTTEPQQATERGAIVDVQQLCLKAGIAVARRPLCAAGNERLDLLKTDASTDRRHSGTGERPLNESVCLRVAASEEDLRSE